MQSNFVSNSRESSRMFKSSLLEGLSKVHYSVPLFIFVPIVAYFGWKAFAVAHNSLLTFAVSAAAGLLVWTLTEYVLHRFVFHFVPTSKWGQRLHFIFHGVHHDFPNDSYRLVMPPSVSIPLAIGFFALFQWLIPQHYLFGFFAAFITGYLFYDLSHYALHHANFKSEFWKKMKHHHMTHHYADPDHGFGVTTSLWDKVLNSNFKKK